MRIKSSADLARSILFALMGKVAGLLLVTVAVMLAAWPSVALAGSQGITVNAEGAVTRSFFAHGQHAGATILAMRESTGSPRVVGVLYRAASAHPAAARGDTTGFYCSGGAACTLNFWSQLAPTGEWKPDTKVTSKMRAQLVHGMQFAFSVSEKVSGTDTVDASTVGDLADNPYCREDGYTEHDQTTFSYSTDVVLQPTLGGDSFGAPAKLDAMGTSSVDARGGCVGGPGEAPSSPQHYACSVPFRANGIASLPALAHAYLSVSVDARGRHELRLYGPGITSDSCPVNTGVPTSWADTVDSPITYGHSILIPDAEIQQKASQDGGIIKFPIQFSGHPPFCSQEATSYTHPQSDKCTEDLTWKGTILIKVFDQHIRLENLLPN